LITNRKNSPYFGAVIEAPCAQLPLLLNVLRNYHVLGLSFSPTVFGGILILNLTATIYLLPLCCTSAPFSLVGLIKQL
jgi:hypothetical protein